MYYKLFLILFLFSPSVFSIDKCRIRTLNEDQIMARSKEIYEDAIELSNIRATLSKISKFLYGPKQRKKLLRRLRILNRKRGIYPAYYIKDQEFSITQIDHYRKLFTESAEDIAELSKNQATKQLFEMAPETITSWIKDYKNFTQSKDQLLERVVSLENQLKDLEKITTYNRRIDLYKLENKKIVLDRKYTRYISNEEEKLHLMNAINNEINKITGNRALALDQGSILNLDYNQAVLRSKLELLWKELNSYYDQEGLKKPVEFFENYMELSILLEKTNAFERLTKQRSENLTNKLLKAIEKRQSEINLLKPTDLALSQLRFHETHKELVDLVTPKFLRKEAVTPEQKLARLQKLRSEQQAIENGYEILVSNLDKFALFYRRYGILVLGGTFVGVSVPAITTLKNFFLTDKTRRQLCIDILNPTDPSYVGHPDRRSEDFEDCYFRYIKRKLGKKFLEELESGLEITVQIKGPNESDYTTKKVRSIERHPKFSKYLEIEKLFRETLREQNKNWRKRESLQNEYINAVDPDNLRKGFPLNQKLEE